MYEDDAHVNEDAGKWQQQQREEEEEEEESSSWTWCQQHRFSIDFDIDW